jgi:RimJ/RimL family protein N-acetyltransferase
MLRGLHQLIRSVDRHGLIGAGRRVLGEAWSLAYLHQEHVWYSLELAPERPRRSMPDELRITREGADGDLPPLAGDEAHERHASGAEIWVVRDEDQAAFACWIFRERAPVLAAPTGWLEIPSGAVVLEDSVTSPSFRGRGIAPAAWSAIADSLTVEGLERMLTKVEVENASSRRAVEKASFAEVAIMRLTRVGFRKRVEIEAFDPMGFILAEKLTARLSPRSNGD